MKNALVVLFFFFLTKPTFLMSQQIEVSVQRGHSAAVPVSKVSPDGKILATGSKDKSVKIWEIAKGRELRTFSEHEFSVTDIAFHPDEAFVASADAGGNIMIWNYKNGEILYSWYAHDGVVESISFSSKGDLLISGGRDDLAKVWDWKKQMVKNKWKLDGGQYGVRAYLCNDENKIAIAGDNATILLTGLNNPDEIDTLRETSYSMCGGCYSEARFSPDGKWVAAISRSGPLLLCEVENPDNKIILNERIDDFNNIQWNNDNKFLLLSTPDRTEIYNITKRTSEITINKKDKRINQSTYSPKGEFIFQATDGNRVDMYASNGEWVRSFAGKLGDPIVGDLNLDPNSYWESSAYKTASLKNKFTISPNGKWAIKGKTGNMAVLWDWQKGKPYRILKGHEKAITAFQFSPDNKYLLTGDSDGKVVMWDILKGDSILSKRFHYNMLLDFAVSHDGKLLATGGYDGYLDIIELNTFKLLKRINVSGTSEYVDSPFSISFSPNDNYVVAGSLGKKLIMFEVDSGEKFREFLGHTDFVTHISFYQDRMITASKDGKIKAWDFRNGYQEWKITSSSNPEYDLLVLPEKNWVISAGADRVIKVWDLTTHDLVMKLEGHTGPVNSLNYLKENDLLISSTGEGEVRYWNLGNPESPLTQYFTGPEDYVIINKSGFFNATQGARDAVIFVNGTESYQPEQFFEKFYRSDLLPMAYHGKRSIDDEAVLTDVIEKSPPPIVDIVVPKDGENFSASKINVLVKASNTGGGIDAINLAHNGKIIVTKIDKESRVQQSGKSVTETYQLQLLPGKNTLEAFATNRAQIESERSKIVVEYGGKEAVKKCFILVIGINKYKNSRLNLNYAVSDAQSVANLLKENEGSLYQQVDITELYDKDATKENIISSLESISKKAGPSDTFYFYYAGHGSMVDNHFYFIPTENTRLYDGSTINEEGISDSDLQEKFKKIAALKQVVVIDACQSGGGVQTLATRGAGSEKAMAQLSRSSGVHVMASSGSDQFATEFEELGHGLFTYTLIEALKGEADGAPKDGSVSVYELKSYLDAKVPVYSELYKGEAQYPFTFSIGQDFPIIIEE